jgi:hypothetical protein
MPAKIGKAKVRREKRTDDTLHLRQPISGTLDTPREYNAAFANVLRALADKIETVGNAWVDPEVVVWMCFRDRIEAEATFAPME